ncbi:MAG: hypothetical protein KGJ14_06500, partial [Nitrospirota bacterium]|nr:hypothetical protein [Nitrospirota bacterium]
ICAQAAGTRPGPSPVERRGLAGIAVKVLGEEALDLETLSRRRKRALGDQPLLQGLGDFFFEGDNPLHPER